MQATFVEEQKFTQWWLWLMLGLVGLMPLIAIYQQIILGRPIGDNPLSNLGLVFATLFVYGLIALFGSMKLTTHIDTTGIYMRYFPFARKRVLWSEVKSAEVVDYGFVGYGIRFGSRYGIVYNTSGSKGLAIEKTNGKRFVIGTQRPEELRLFLKQLPSDYSLS